VAPVTHGRQVIHILDQRILNPVADQLAYTLSKQALWQATRTLAISLAPAVRVNAIAPGLTLPTQDYAPGQMDRIAGMMPLGLLPSPADIAEAALYLASARAVTGQTIFVDGGANLTAFPQDFVDL
jgi:pteridine reductase